MKPYAMLPEIEISMGDRKLGTTELACLSIVRVVQKLSLPTLCEVVFSGVDDGFARRCGCRKQTAWTLFAAGDARPLFQGIVTAIEYCFRPSGELDLFVRGYDRMYFAGKKQRIHTHIETTVGEMAKEMVKGHGIDVAAARSGPVWQQLVQFQETDLDFLARIAMRSGLYFFMNRDGRLDIIDLTERGDPVLLTRGENLIELSLEVNDAPTLDSVYASGWDPFLAEFHDGRAELDRTGGGERKLADIGLRSSTEAEAVCRGELARCRAHETTVRGVASGNSDLAPGATVRIE